MNREAAELSGLLEGEIFTMDNFTYNNSVVVSQMFKHLNNTFFPGISVSIRDLNSWFTVVVEGNLPFSQGNEVYFIEGVREIHSVTILQYQFDSNST